MNCCKFQETAVAMSRCEPVESAERERWLAHLAGCCQCAAMARQQELLTTALGCLRSDASPPLDVELAVLAAFRSRGRRVPATGAIPSRILPPSVPNRPPNRPADRPLFGWRSFIPALVAGAVLCLLIYSGTRKSNLPVTPVTVSEKGGSEFIPFPFAQPIEPQEQVDIYRVRVPASAVVSLDASAANAHPGGLVTADLVVGADGVARGIRFVHQE